MPGLITVIVLVVIFGGLGTILHVQTRRRNARFDEMTRTSQMAVVNAELEAERARNQTTADAYAGRRPENIGYFGPF